MAKTNARLAISWLELIFIALLVVTAMSLWLFFEHQVDLAAKEQEPRAETFQQMYNIPGLQSELDATQAELKATVAKLGEQRVELARQSAQLDALTAAFPKLTTVAQVSASTLSETEVPTKTVQSYVDQKASLDATSLFVERLNTRLGTLSAQEATQATALAIGQQAAAGRLAQAQQDHAGNKRWQTLEMSGGSVIALLLVAFGLVAFFVPGDRYRLNKALVFPVAAAIIAVLFAYQAFLAAGAAIAGLIVLLALLALLSRYISRPANAGGVGGPP